MTIFNIKKELEKSNFPGGFFCLACLVGKPADDQSADPRYCQSCYDVLTEETTTMPKTKRPAWLPLGARKARQGTPTTTESGQIPSDSIENGGTSTSEVVTAQIMKLSGDKLSYRGIEKALATEGIKISYRTIGRIIKKQGALL